MIYYLHISVDQSGYAGFLFNYHGKAMLRILKKLWLKDRFLFLLISLILLLVISPILADLNAVTIFLELFMTLTMVLCLGASQESKSLISIGIILAIPAILTGWLAQFITWPIMVSINNLLDLVFLVFVFVNLMRIILTSRRVTSHVIYGAICAYLMLGLAFSNIYLLLISYNPASFLIHDGTYVSTESFKSLIDVFYYSYVTLTTLGYGDIIPATSVARMLSSVEALIGQLFLAVIVARLVALHVTHDTRKVFGEES